jgi:hypothetical protein
MKKLEKLDSKLFEEFKMDEVSSLASVVGGWSCVTTPCCGLPADTWKQDTSIWEDEKSDPYQDIKKTNISNDGIAYSGPGGPIYDYSEELVNGSVLPVEFEGGLYQLSVYIPISGE